MWKRQYYSRWVRPRARRLANSRRATLPLSKVEYSPKVSTWLDHSHLAGEGKVTNWKRQYRLRHNWSRGICHLTEVELPQPSQPPMRVEFCAGMVFTADASCGLRTWIAKNPTTCVASAPLSASQDRLATPTALTATRCLHRKAIQIGVGFQDGAFRIYSLDIETLRLHIHITRDGSVDGAITAMASSSPYLLTVTQNKVLSLYELPVEVPGKLDPMTGPRRLASLQADSIVAPISLSLRTTASEIVASVVYNFFHLGCAWSLGIQELRLDKSGRQISSQLATTVDSQYGVKPLHPISRLGRRCSASDDHSLRRELRSVPTEATIIHQEPPTSISYSHPYLLTSHADNTLTMYLVVSTTENLLIKSGQRLWGHTSSVSTVRVSDRGKAVSVSSRGDEIRIWELEPVMSLFGLQRGLKEENSIQVTPESKQHRQWEDLQVDRRAKEERLAAPRLVRIRNCVGFDDERVVLLRERERGTQMLECYDFT